MYYDRTMEQDAEMMRLQILGDPNLMRQLQEVRIPCISLYPYAKPSRFYTKFRHDLR